MVPFVKFFDSQQDIAVALSGGGDSMALAHMMCVWGASEGRRVHLLTVNHNLRAEAAAEAQWVADKVRNFPASRHYILNWEHETKPDTAIMEKARVARYALMAEYCLQNGIQSLAIAHHADDQLETFLFRLAKGSGLDGLSGMEEKTSVNGITLCRPLLAYAHGDLIRYCEDNGLEWVEDPSNADTGYARPRLRLALREEGLDAKRFAKTLERLARAKSALNAIADDVYGRCYSNGQINWATVKTYPLDIQIRVLQKALSQAGETQSGYPPKLERIEEIVSSLRPDKSATLYGCVLTMSKNGNTLEIKGSKA